MRKLIVTRKAQADISATLQYTAKIWGRAQHGIYKGKLNEGLSFIQENPLAGSLSPYLAEGFRLHFVGSHVVVYQVADEKIIVRRVLHQNMSLGKWL